jgi:2-phospho-L-lactate guanylyltransferase
VAFRPLVDLIVPVKSLAHAKSRLRGAADDGRGDRATHAALVLAIVEDTLVAARAAQVTRRILVVTPDPRVAQVAGRCGAEVAPEQPP